MFIISLSAGLLLLFIYFFTIINSWFLLFCFQFSFTALMSSILRKFNIFEHFGQSLTFYGLGRFRTDFLLITKHDILSANVAWRRSISATRPKVRSSDSPRDWLSFSGDFLTTFLRGTFTRPTTRRNRHFPLLNIMPNYFIGLVSCRFCGPAAWTLFSFLFYNFS